jgi:DNA repair protein RadC
MNEKDALVREAVALYASLNPQCADLAADILAHLSGHINEPEDAEKHFVPILRGRSIEHFAVLPLDAKNQPLGRPVIVATGNDHSCEVPIGSIMRVCIEHGASCFIVAHNHPSGITDPSPEDIAITRRLEEAGKVLRLDLLDHIIVGRYECFSMTKSRLWKRNLSEEINATRD